VVFGEAHFVQQSLVCNAQENLPEWIAAGAHSSPRGLVIPSSWISWTDGGGGWVGALGAGHHVSVLTGWGWPFKHDLLSRWRLKSSRASGWC